VSWIAVLEWYGLTTLNELKSGIQSTLIAHENQTAWEGWFAPAVDPFAPGDFGSERNTTTEDTVILVRSLATRTENVGQIVTRICLADVSHERALIVAVGEEEVVVAILVAGEIGIVASWGEPYGCACHGKD
jgi:hypothetical protein